MQSTSSRDRLRMLGQVDLGASIEILSGEKLWSIQRKIAKALSHERAKLAVPSCNASGKTWLAARLALAFYDAFTPGVPCVACGGPCGGSKVITISSKEEHLRDNLWGELRASYAHMADMGLEPKGRLYPGDLRLESVTGKHYIIGQTANTQEGLQGAHAAHKLIIGDEATSVSDEVSKGITSLLPSGDTRLLLIFNPTTPETYAGQMSRSDRFATVKITAYDTPHFTGESAPPGSNLITPMFLEDLMAQGMGPGTYEWTTRVLADFWDLSDDTLVSGPWYDKAMQLGRGPEGIIQLGVDIAPYGTSENVIAVREGYNLTDIRTYPAMRVDHFFQGPVTDMVKASGAHYVVYDADGVGAGAIGYADDLHKHMAPGGQVIGFRGALRATTAYFNTRAAWYWNLRRRLENGLMHIQVDDPKLREQLTSIRYSIQTGAIKVETKAEMRKRNMASPDRADAVMYAFAMSEDLQQPHAKVESPVSEFFGVRSRSEDDMWERDLEGYDGHMETNAVLGVPD